MPVPVKSRVREYYNYRRGHCEHLILRQRRNPTQFSLLYIPVQARTCSRRSQAIS